MRDFIRKPRNWFAVMIVLAVLAALMMNFFSSFGTNMPSYSTPNDLVEPDIVRPEEPQSSIETVLYTSELGFSMQVPKDWTFVVKGGNDTYVNAKDGASIVFAVSDYNPALNSVTRESIYSDIVAANGVFGDYEQVSSSAYLVVYEIGALDYFEYSLWDLDTLVRVSVQIPAQSYTTYREDILAMLDTFSWERANPIPEDYAMYYSEYGSFEFPIPDGWQYGIENGSLVALSADGAAGYQVSVTNTTAYLNDVSQIDYVEAMGSGKPNYMLNSFSNTGSILTAEASFTSDGVACRQIHNIFATGEYQYELVFQYPQNAAEYEQVYLTVAKYLRAL